MIKLKRHLPLFLFFASSLLGFWFLSGGIGPKNDFSVGKIQVSGSSEKVLNASIRAPGSVPQSARNPGPDHTKKGPSRAQWLEQMEKTLLIQGGGQVRKASIEKVDSFNWRMGKVDVPVDSVIVKLEHVKGHRSSFRAIVDSSNGKILQTWDHPVIDDFNNKHTVGIKVDPRYHND